MSRKLFFGLFAVAAMAAVSCNKEIAPNEPAQPTVGQHSVTFVTSPIETKTTLVLNNDIYSAVWTETDDSNFHLFENGVEAASFEMERSNENKVATFKALFNDGATAPYTYTAILSSSFDSGLAYVMNEQSPASNIDGDADILVAKPVTNETLPVGENEEILFQFKRVVSINKMTLKGLEAGEFVHEIEISADKQLAAAYNFANDAYDYTAGSSSIKLCVDDEISSDGTFDVFFVCAPVEDATLTVTVTTTEAPKGDVTRTYTKTFGRTISFDLESVAEFKVNLAGCEVVEETPMFVKVTSASDLTSGNYLIVSEESSVAFDGSLATLDAVSNTIHVDIDNNTIEVNQYTEAAVFAVDVEVGTIMSASGYYIGSSSDANGLNSSETATYTNSISIADANDVAIVSNKAHLRYNSASNQLRFRYYKSSSYTGQKAIQLYKRVGGEAHFITWNLAGINVTTAPKVEYNEGELFDATGMVVTATYVDASDASNTKEEVIDIDDLIISPSEALSPSNTEITITYKGVSTTLEITVIPAPETTLADVLSGGAGEYTVKNVAVYAVQGSAIILGDSSAKMLAYKASNGLKAGDVRTVFGNTIFYQTYTYQFDQPTFSGTGTTTIDHGTAIELDDEATSLQSAFDDPYIHTATYIHAIGEQDGRIITTADDNLIYLPNKPTETDGKTVEIFGYVYAYSKQYSEFLVCAVSVEEYVDPHTPSLSVSPATTAATPSSWPANNDDSKEFTVSATNGTWTISANTVSSWANVSTNGDVIIVTPKEKQASEVHSGSITITLTPSYSGFSSLSETIYLAQAKYTEGGGGTYSLTPDKSSTGRTETAYITSLTEFTYNEISWKMTQWNPSTLQIKTNQSSAASEFRFYNTSAFSGRISKVVITFSALTVADASKLMFVGGTSQVTATSGGTAGTWNSSDKTLTWTPSASDNFTYFAFYQNGKAATGSNFLASADAIVVTYE